jgi:hypothetical protein
MITVRLAWVLVLTLPISSSVFASSVGDVATGKILSETDTVLSLEINPCSKSPETMMFSAPWKKRFVVSKKCPSGSKYDEYVIEQSTQFSNSTGAKIGDVADGVVDQRTDVSVTLNTTPCQTKQKSQFIVFSSPFKVRDSGQGSCPDGRKYKRDTVEQLSLSSSSGSPDWQLHIDWSAANNTNDPGETNCPQSYMEAEQPSCIIGGGRACLMAKAIEAAKAGRCEYAFHLTLITQCHNAGAQQALANAGQGQVCAYLKTR